MSNLWIVMVGAGIASTANPCTLPIVPAYLGTFAGERSRNLQRAVLFGVGLSLSSAALGVAAGAAGTGALRFVEKLQPIAGVGIVLLAIALLAANFGNSRFSEALSFWSWRPLQGKTFNKIPRQANRSLFGSVLLGIGAGVAWTPCVGPVLGAALITAATKATAVEGGLLLTCYGLGASLPFVLLSAVTNHRRIIRALNPYTHYFQRATAVVMLVVGGLMATGLYDSAISRLRSR